MLNKLNEIFENYQTEYVETQNPNYIQKKQILDQLNQELTLINNGKPILLKVLPSLIKKYKTQIIQNSNESYYQKMKRKSMTPKQKLKELVNIVKEMQKDLD